MQYYNYNANNNNYYYYNQNFNYVSQQTNHFDDKYAKYRTNKLNKKFNKEILNFFHQTKLSTIVMLILFCIFVVFSVFYARSLFFTTEQSEQKIEDIATQIEDIVEIKKQNSMRFNEEEAPKVEKQSAAARRERLKEEKLQAQLLTRKRDAVKQAFVHAFNGYSTHAFGYDEIRPVSNETNSSWGAFGITIFDSMDTMLIMNLKEQYEKSLEHVLSVNFEKDHDASFFEFSIRYLGGLLGAYELSKDDRLLQKAKEIGDALLPAFDSPSGIPYSIVNLKTHATRNPKWTGSSSILAEAGSVQLEFKYLSHHLKDPVYAQKAHKVMEVLYSQDKFEGLYPVYIDPTTGNFTSDLVSYGGLGDSFYEYLLKQWILSNKKDDMLLDMYHEAMEGMVKRLLIKTTTNEKLPYIGEYRLGTKTLVPEMDHLVCYAPGMLALGAEGEFEKPHLKLAEELVKGCYRLYEDQPSGIGPERVAIQVDGKTKNYNVLSAKYLLRPETVESIFVLWRKTHNPMYREWGWKIFKAIEKHCKTGSSYSGLMDVTSEKPVQNNSMQSFFLAETLKYLYLLFSDDDVIPLHKYVFTTEAHPLGILVQ